jgi:hypothetical protein
MCYIIDESVSAVIFHTKEITVLKHQEKMSVKEQNSIGIQMFKFEIE